MIWVVFFAIVWILAIASLWTWYVAYKREKAIREMGE